MIPKIIHICWLSKEDPEERFKLCLSSLALKLWHKGYELKFWNYECVDYFMQYDFFRFHYEQKHWAFCADYIRTYALYTYGGIYLDMDAEVCTDFEKILHLKTFIGLEKFDMYGDKENAFHGHNFEAAIMGFEPNNILCEKVLNRLNLNDPNYGIGWNILPDAFAYEIKKLDYKIVNSIKEAEECEKENIIPLFNAPSFDDFTSDNEEQDYKIVNHHFFNTWC